MLILLEPGETIECEDYNYSNGVFQLDPIPVSGMPTTVIRFRSMATGSAILTRRRLAWFSTGRLGGGLSSPQ